MPADATVPNSPGAPISPDGPTVPLEDTTSPPTVAFAEAHQTKVEPAITAEPAKPEVWAARVAIPGAVGPGQKKKAAPPVAPTQTMARYEPNPTVVSPRPAVRNVPASPPPHVGLPRRRRSAFKRFLLALVAVLLLLAVPVVSAYVAYKLASGENPFDWPPSVDLSHVF